MTRLGVAISTKNRRDVLAQAVAAHWKFYPNTWGRDDLQSTPKFVVVDDGSEEPLTHDDLGTPRPHRDIVEIVHHRESLGIAATKNRGIAELMAAGCSHLFLFDDDAWPTEHGWWLPYVDHPEGHLQHNYVETNAHDAELAVLYDDERTAAYHSSRGVMLYYTRQVIETVGGMDPAYRYGFEHIEHSERIHAAGLTTWAHQSPSRTRRAQLLSGGEPPIHSADQAGTVDSVITARERREHTTPNLQLLAQHRGRTTFVPYTDPDNRVLTCLFTGITDAQNGREPWEASDEYALILLGSLGHSQAVRRRHDKIPYTVLHNEDIPHRHDDPNWVRVSVSANPPMNVYVQRWVSLRAHLIDNPTIEKVWIVDCGDVELLQHDIDIFSVIKPNTLYIGVEPQLTGCAWMLKNHQASSDWLKAHPRLPLYNAGVLGGDRATVLTFIDRILTAYRQSVVRSITDQAGDMGFIQRAVHDMATEVVSGPHITSVFKGYQNNAPSLWRHK